MATVILAMVITAFVMPFTAGAQNELVDARRTLSSSLAQEMVEEILSRAFPAYGDPPGPLKTRDEFSDMDDYDGYTETEGEIVGLDDLIVDDPAARGLSRHTTVTFVYLNGQDTSEDPIFLRIRVDIKYRNISICTLTRLVYGKPRGVPIP